MKPILIQNWRVYLMRVPLANSLPPLLAFSLVKCLPMNEVLNASKEKMYASLVLNTISLVFADE